MGFKRKNSEKVESIRFAAVVSIFLEYFASIEPTKELIRSKRVLSNKCQDNKIKNFALKIKNLKICDYAVVFQTFFK